MDSLKISEADYKKIKKKIGSDQSVVGIDAKKTHIIIIHMLEQIQSRLDRLENRMDELEK